MANIIKNILSKIKFLLPGIFLIGYNVGVGSITCMTKSGAAYGTTLLWVILCSCIITFFVLDCFGRYTVLTGYTLFQGIRKNIHPWLAHFMIFSLVIIMIPALMGLMGIMSDVLYEWSLTWLEGGISSIIWTVMLSLFVCFSLFGGASDRVKNVINTLVLIMFVAFMINLVVLLPSLSEIAEGFTFKLPNSAGDDGDLSSFMIVASMVGTTVSPIVFIMRSVLSKDEQIGVADLKRQRIDALCSAIGMFLICSAVLMSASSTLFKNGLEFTHPKDLIPLLEPIAGNASVALVTLGVVAAGLSSHVPNILVIPWVLSDYNGESLASRSKGVVCIIVVSIALGFVIPIFQLKPVLAMLVSQTFLAILLPLVTISIFVLSSKAKILSPVRSVLLTIVVIFSLIMSAFGLYGIFA